MNSERVILPLHIQIYLAFYLVPIHYIIHYDITSHYYTADEGPQSSFFNI